MKFHHIGYAVEDIYKSIKRFEQLGYHHESNLINDELRDVLIAFMRIDQISVELIQPKSLNSIAMPILKKYKDIPYHIAYEVKNIGEKTKELLKFNYKILLKPERAVAFSNNKVVFIYAKNLVMVELIENPILESTE